MSAVLFFFVVCVSTASTVKETAILLLLLTLAVAFLFFSRVRERFMPPMAALAALTLMCGVSTLYALSGKFALYEFLKVVISFCLAVVILAFAEGEGDAPGLQAACALEGCAALAGLVSIDLMSTRLISGPVLGLLSAFTPDYADLIAVEAGVRMNSIFANPNVFAGCAGLGVLLSLGLALSASGTAARMAHQACLFVNALAFLLAFSMGASAMIALAFLVYLLLAGKRRPALLVLMLETLALTVAAAGLVSATSFSAWTEPRPVPLACTVLGAAALCGLDFLLGRRLADKLEGKGRAIVLITAGLAAAGLVFVLLAWNLTGAAGLEAGRTLRRAAYPAPGAYTLALEADGTVTVAIESQNQRETMMHTRTLLYRGEAQGAAFTVPEDSLVVYFNFYAPEGALLERAAFQGEAGGGSIPLGYKLLPGFIANRLQGLWANQNAIQRLVFFSDGLKLFRRSPVFGLGMGAFENAIQSVQSFRYETKYAHNHYIQLLVETGVVGLALFLVLLALSGAAVLLAWRRGEEAHPLTPALGAALVFMAGHAAAEVTFSFYAYLPMAFGVFALIDLCCADALPRLRVWTKAARTGVVIGMCALLGVFGVLLVGNMRARSIYARAEAFSDLPEAIRLDRFEWADYMLTYVDSAWKVEVDGGIRRQADEYAGRLSRVQSNTMPIYLAEYYLATGQTGAGLEMLEKHVRYVSSDPAAWQGAFQLLERYDDGSGRFRAAVVELADLLEAWNGENLDDITVDEQAQAFIARARGVGT